MSFNPCRRRGHHGGAGSRARQSPVDLHEGSRREYLRRHEEEASNAARGTNKEKRQFAAKLLQRVADSRTLRLAWDLVRLKGGKAPGVDGIRPDDLQDHEFWSWARAAGTAIKKEDYKPSPDRKKKISKGPGRGTRTLSIPTFFDRVIQKANVLILQPYLDRLFLDSCLGSRPGRGIHHALARAEQLTVEGGYRVWLLEDLDSAFNRIPQKRLLDVGRLYLPDEGIMRLMERLIVKGNGKGVRQGGSLSPLLFNLFLFHLLDRKWQKLHLDLPLLRYMDDLLVLCRTVEEAQVARQTLIQLLTPAGMLLQDKKSKVCNLEEGDRAEWLGYSLTWGQDWLEARLQEEGPWEEHLEKKMALANTEEDAPLRANDLLMGWLNHQGPAFPHSDVQGVYARVTHLAHSQGFEEILSREEFCSQWEQSFNRWEKIRRKAWQ